MRDEEQLETPDPHNPVKLMTITFSPISIDDYEPVRQFLSDAGWQKRVADPGEFAKMIAHSSRTIVAHDGQRIVGFARAVCDQVCNGYISMVAVAEDKRGQGIGRELVRSLVADDTGITWVLRAGHGSEAFWEKVGFRHSEVAMERVRSLRIGSP